MRMLASKKDCQRANRSIQRLLSAVLLANIFVLLNGCGHLVTGYSSIPYLESHPLAADNRIHAGIPKSDVIVLGAKVSVNLWNEVYTSAPEAKAFNRIEPGDYVMHLQITPQTSGLTFEPMAVKLSINGQTYAVKTFDGSETDMRIDPPRGRLRKFAAWDGRGKQQKSPTVLGPMLLTEGCFYSLMLHFDAPRPNPDNNIMIDLSGALKGQNKQAAEHIYFRKMFWQEMHQ